MKIAVCIACHNRRDVTLSCLENLYESQMPANATLSVYVFDDGSADDSGKAIKAQFPNVKMFQGDGQQYWARSMRVIYSAAREEIHDYYLWLNDDVQLFRDTLNRAVSASLSLKKKGQERHLIAGAMRSPDLGPTTYSGYVRSNPYIPWKFQMIEPDLNNLRECDTVNGNFLLIPNEFSTILGNINPQYIQMHADFEYGLKSRRKGGVNWLLPGFAGTCPSNPFGRKKFEDPSLPIKERISLMNHPLGYPLMPSIAYSKNFGFWAPLMVIGPYVKLIYTRISFQISQFLS